MATITTPEGTKVTLDHTRGGMQLVSLTAADDPDRPVFGGFITDGAYAPPSEALIALRPSTMRAIADLIEEN